MSCTTLKAHSVLSHNQGIRGEAMEMIKGFPSADVKCLDDSSNKYE